MNFELVDDDTHVISGQIDMSWMRIKAHLYLVVAEVCHFGLPPLKRNYPPTNDLWETKV